MSSKKETVAEYIADSHFGVEPNLKQVYILEPIGSDDDDEPIKLLEVVDGSVSEGIYPVGFAANPGAGIPYRSVIVEIAPEEWPDLKAKGSFSVRGREWRIGRAIHPKTVAA